MFIALAPGQIPCYGNNGQSRGEERKERMLERIIFEQMHLRINWLGENVNERQLIVNFTNILWKAFLYFQFVLVIFWKESGTKTVLKRLSKLITGVNFISTLWVAFLFGRVLPSFSLLTICACKFLAKGIWFKSCS